MGGWHRPPRHGHYTVVIVYRCSWSPLIVKAFIIECFEKISGGGTTTSNIIINKNIIINGRVDCKDPSFKRHWNAIAHTLF
jgi:hypothetical protein